MSSVARALSRCGAHLRPRNVSDPLGHSPNGTRTLGDAYSPRAEHSRVRRSHPSGRPPRARGRRRRLVFRLTLCERPRGFLPRPLPRPRPRPRSRHGRHPSPIQGRREGICGCSCRRPPGGPKINLPTALTLIRVAAVPLVTWIFYQPGAWVAPTCCAIFIAAAITDWADGYLARKMKLVSSFGAFLDPVADKLMVAAALVLLCTKTAAGLSAVSMAIPATIISGREITMSAIREWAAAAGGEAHGAVAVNSYGKWKTATQLVALSILLGVRDGCDWLGLSGAAANYLVQGGVYCLYASAALALLSLYIYMAGVIKYMN